MDNEIDRKIDVTAILFLLVQNRQQTQDWTLIGSGADGLGIQECFIIFDSIYPIFVPLNITLLGVFGPKQTNQQDNMPMFKIELATVS